MIMMGADEARAMRALMVASAERADDREASRMPRAYPRLRGNGELVRAGARICWPDGGRYRVMRAAADLWDWPENDPRLAPDLWEEIAFREGERIIPDVITEGLKFGKGELGWRGDTLWRSLLEVNTWTPEEYPDGWEVVREC